MTRNRLSFRDLRGALDQFSGRYDAVDVFADDVEEIRELHLHGQVPGVQAASADGRSLIVNVDGTQFRADLDTSKGILRFSRAPTPPRVAELGALGGAAGAAVAAAASKKGTLG